MVSAFTTSRNERTEWAYHAVLFRLRQFEGEAWGAMETQTRPDTGYTRISFGKTGATVKVVLATTLWITVSICLIPVLGIGIFLLPLTAEFMEKTRRTSSAEPAHPTVTS